MKHITNHTSNPFGMRPPCANGGSSPKAVFGYGDVNGDFHFIGDHPAVHGGVTTGVPFTESPVGRAIQLLLYESGFAVADYSTHPILQNCFLSYIHLCCPDNGDQPSQSEYLRLERYFDAELRAVNAHILLPVGQTATEHIVREYTTQASKYELNMDALHGTDLRGRGCLVLPIKSPRDWDERDRETINTALARILNSDYRQTKGVATRIG